MVVQTYIHAALSKSVHDRRQFSPYQCEFGPLIETYGTRKPTNTTFDLGFAPICCPSKVINTLGLERDNGHEDSKPRSFSSSLAYNPAINDAIIELEI